MVVEIYGLHPEKVGAVFLIEAVQKHAVEVLVQLGGSVFDQHLHLVDQLCGHLAIHALCRTVFRQIFAADRLVALGAMSYYDLARIYRVHSIDAEADSEVVSVASILWQALEVKEQVLQSVEHERLVTCALLWCRVSSDIGQVHSAHQHLR